MRSSFSHSHGTEVELGFSLEAGFSLTLHSPKDLVHLVLHGSLLGLQLIQALLKVSDCHPQPVPHSSQNLLVFPHLHNAE